MELLREQSTQIPTVWSYQELKNYLSVVPTDQQSIPSIDQFPEIIHLKQLMHTYFGWMSLRTRIRLSEEYALVSADIQKGDILLPFMPSQGEKCRIQPAVIRRDIMEDKQDGLTPIGHAHSHIPDQPTPAAFSPDDIYTVVRPNRPFTAFIAVIEGSQEVFAFTTKESNNRSVKPEITQEVFRQLWYDKVGSDWELNLLMAQRYNLALYKGKIGQALIRFYPPIPQATW